MPTDKATFPRNKVLHGETHLDSIDSTGADRGGTGHPAGPALKKKGGTRGEPGRGSRAGTVVGGRPPGRAGGKKPAAGGGSREKGVIITYIIIYKYIHINIYSYKDIKI